VLIPRRISGEFKKLLDEYPVVTILGPRQAGKTTLARMVLPGYAHVNLELPDERGMALNDPRAFLARFPGNTILDEVQRAPELLSYIQGIVDEEGVNGRFVLTGSHQLQLRASIAQSLAGRTALLTLLPFSIRELDSAGLLPGRFEECAFKGFLPRIYDQNLRPLTAYANYYQTYVERDVRQMIQVRDALSFEKFLKLLAGRAGQLMDYTSLANDVGVDAKTIKHWCSILEASFLVFKLPPYFQNFGKRVIKSPKYYFVDTGLLCFLLGIRSPDQVSRDPLVGSIFENLVVAECLKGRAHRGLPPDLYFHRDSNGREIDLLLAEGQMLHAAEIKSASTFTPGMLNTLRSFRKTSQRQGRSMLIYNGDARRLSDGMEAISFRQTETFIG
jgi:hypothetical protein